MRFRPLFLLAAVAVAGLAAPPAAAQSDRALYNQDRLAEILYSNRTDLASIPEVAYYYYTLEDRYVGANENPAGNTNDARIYLFQELGGGDVALGRESASEMVAFLNGVFIDQLRIGDTIVLPTEVGLDARAYSPFPRVYEGGREFEKLFVIDKGVQAWAAYEGGELARWGLVSTGAPGSETPSGRFNFNWKEEYRVSTLSPPGETWEMRWVFNFHDRRGIHVHQYYALPTSGPASHGCVRLMTRDAQWIYDWADGWRTSNGGASRGLASRGRIDRQGTTVLVIGTEPDGPPRRFRDADGRPALVRVDLPDHPFDVAPGTPQQERFDRLRARRASS